MDRQPYVHIFIHGDAYADAVSAVTRLARRLGDDDPDVAALQDALDPRPEVDIYGYMPNVRRSRLLPKVTQ